jgi:hypothetical protein
MGGRDDTGYDFGLEVTETEKGEALWQWDLD